MIGGGKSPSIPPVTTDHTVTSSKSTSGVNFALGSEDFPRLKSSSLPIENGGFSISETFRSENNRSYVLKAPASVSPSTELAFHEPKNPDGETIPFFSSGELQPHFVGYFVGKNPPFLVVKENLNNQWNTKGEVSMTIHGKQAFLFKFSHEDDRKMVLELGSVHIGSKLFLIRPWTPFIEQQLGCIKSVLVRMILRDIPLHLWNATGFSKIASYVGILIMRNSPTAIKTRMAYAEFVLRLIQGAHFLK
ncbi:uncharacterized protein LOC113317443 [Papaver somniferum]|uniref:uncharacterized protein LOC113317443 n=1 Tax=Papaver somniferum TaxID=3469 RepID=UPI000E6FB509|nr:uncharacterized protein LOC113317443 [Papaver somniferum]